MQSRSSNNAQSKPHIRNSHRHMRQITLNKPALDIARHMYSRHTQRLETEVVPQHGRISDAHYASSFGSGHSFHVNRGEYNSRRFDYGGYSFGFVDPWPVGWGYSDDVYVVYTDGGYYMYDHIHPGLRISINIL